MLNMSSVVSAPRSSPYSEQDIMHLLRQKSAKCIYDYDITNSLHVCRPEACHVHVRVVACIPNHSLRQLLEGLISKVEASAATVLPCVTVKLAEEVRPVVPFPGKGARFEVSHVWSKQQYSGVPLCRRMELRSMTPASFLKEIIVCGYQDGSITLVMVFRGTRTIQDMSREEEDVFEKYVSDSGFEPQLPPTTFFAKTPTELNWVLTVLANHNEVPQREFQFMKRLVEANGWRAVEQEMEQSRQSRQFSSFASSAPSSSRVLRSSSSRFELKANL